jgi:hypothetical protein
MQRRNKQFLTIYCKHFHNRLYPACCHQTLKYVKPLILYMVPRFQQCVVLQPVELRLRAAAVVEFFLGGKAYWCTHRAY